MHSSRLAFALLSVVTVGVVPLIGGCAGENSDTTPGGGSEGGDPNLGGGGSGGEVSTGGQGGGVGGGQGGLGGEGGEGGAPVVGCPQDCSTVEVPVCYVATCNEETHVCEIAPAEDGAACEDGEYCTVDDTCTAGTCEAGGPRDCSGGGADDCHTSSCDEEADACSDTPVANGTPCTSADVCLSNTACFNGQCQGAPMDCSATPLDAPECQAAQCDPATGACVVVPINDGIPCTFGDICESDKQCDMGACIGTPIPDCQGCTESEPNNTYAVANTGQGCVSWSGGIAVVGDIDCYQVEVTVPGSRILAEMVDVSGSGCPAGYDGYFRLFNSTGTQIATDDDGGNGLCPMFLPTNAGANNVPVGIYSLCVEELGNNATSPPYLVLLSAAAPGCGDAIVNGTEQCDGSNLSGQTCISQGFGSGTLSCDANCNFNTSQCAAPFCGDGLVNGTEDCDGAALGGATCISEGFAGGSLACDASCAFNTAGCVAAGCGNALLEFGEDCDGSAGCTATCEMFTCAAGEVPFEVTGTGLPLNITDNASFTSTATVPTTGTIKALGVQINITHTYDGDLDISLTGPAAAAVDLSSDNGGTNENYVNTVFSALGTTSITAGTAPYTGIFTPEGNLTSTYNTTANGTWTLTVADDAGGDVGTLNSWRMFGCIQP
ncbi:MAG: hypothetical protein HOW73_42705 [Polyangiaceae bacterium]|nr:hypothetical protein [Polyangiaceae bacterium]